MDSILLELRNKIEDHLLPLIDNKYVLYGLPFYNNIGDVLIWEGTRQLLKKTKQKCIGCYASSVPIREKLSSDTIIIIMGGGFFGDVWRKSFEYALSNIDGRMQNKIIFLPQSISYVNNDLLNHDIMFFRKFHNLYICVRDSKSFEFANKYFTNNVLLIPDMALYIDPESIQEYILPPIKQTLYIQRTDHEKNSEISFADVEVHDWPTMDKLSFKMFLFKALYKVYFFLISFSILDFFLVRKLINNIGENYFRKYMLKTGVSFLSQYNSIVTTRLHPMILAYLLNIKVSFVDNTNRKISSLYDTWFRNVDNITNYSSSD